MPKLKKRGGGVDTGGKLGKFLREPCALANLSQQTASLPILQIPNHHEVLRRNHQLWQLRNRQPLHPQGQRKVHQALPFSFLQ
jgi:hypothetical protein